MLNQNVHTEEERERESFTELKEMYRGRHFNEKQRTQPLKMNEELQRLQKKKAFGHLSHI